MALAMLFGGCGGSSNSSSPSPVAPQINGLWVANSGGPNVLQFLSKQTGANGVVNKKPNLILNSSSPSFTSPQDSLFDTSGNLWVVDGGASGAGEGVFEFTQAQLQALRKTPNPTPAFAITNSAGVPGFNFPQFAVFDASGDLFVEDTGANVIDAYSATQLTTTSGTGLVPACVFTSTDFNGPLGAVFDSAGNLFVAQNGGTTVVRINAADLNLTNAACSPGPVALTPEVILSSDTPAAGTPPSINGPWGLALDSGGNLWVSNEQLIAPNNVAPGTVVEFAATDITASGTPTPVVTLTSTTVGAVGTLDDPQGIGFSAAGDLAVANDANNTISVFSSTQLTTGSPVPKTLVSGANVQLSAPTGLIFGPTVTTAPTPTATPTGATPTATPTPTTATPTATPTPTAPTPTATPTP
jgi:hypothetical protein